MSPWGARGDDWLTYKENALSTLDGGLMMPAVRGPYRRPGGFLYNYFLAGLFRALGINASYVYVVQSLLLGVSVSLMYLAFRPCLAPVSGLVYLGAVALFMYADYRRFAFRLLSENLLLFLLRWAWDSRWSLPSTSDLTGCWRGAAPSPSPGWLCIVVASTSGRPCSGPSS